MRRDLVMHDGFGMWCGLRRRDLNRRWNDFRVRSVMVIDGDLGELAVLEEHRMADEPRRFASN